MTKKHLVGITNQVKYWYYGIDIPHCLTPGFAPFLASNAGLITLLLNKTSKTTVSFTKDDLIGAYDRSRDVILLSDGFTPISGNKKYLNEVSEHVFADEASNILIAIASGVMTHEITHLFLSEDMHSYGTAEEFNDILFMCVVQTLEDHRVENYIRSKVDTIYWMLQASHEWFFDKEPNPNPSLVAEYLEAIAFSRNRRFKYFPSNPTMKKIIGKVSEFSRMWDKKTFTDRKAIVHEVYDILKKLQEKEPKNEEQEEGNGKDNQSKSDGLSELLKRMDLKEDVNSEQMTTIQTFESAVGGFGNDTSESTLKINMWNDFSPIIGMKTNSRFFENIKGDDRWKDLSRLLKIRSERRHLSSAHEQRGLRLKSPHRLATDSKIFVTPQITQAMTHQNVLFLLDFSGSMLDEHDKLTIKMLNAIKTGVNALISGGHKVAVYAHMADINIHSEHYALILMALKPFESNLTLDRSLKNLESFGILYGSNNDDLAIRECAKILEKSCSVGSKRIVVMSDGAPASRRFDDEDMGIFKTRAMVDAVRKTGITVNSISMKEIANEPCESIYGKENTICSEDPGVVNSLIASWIK